MIVGIKKRSCCEICGGQKESWQDVCAKCRLDMQNAFLGIAHKKPHLRKIYAISVARDPLANVKFGFSLDPVRRMDDMQVGCPVLLELLAFCDGTYPVEQAIHRYLNDSWHHGEWFSRSEKVVGVIAAIREDRLKTHIATGLCMKAWKT